MALPAAELGRPSASSTSPTWLSIGFIVADWGGILFLLALALGGIGIYRLAQRQGRRRSAQGDDGHLARPHLAYVVAVWAMTGKPGKPGAGAAATPAVSAGNSAATVTVTATEFRFTLSQASVPHGTVVFKVENSGKLAHDFSIGGKTSSLVAPNKSTTLTVTLDAGKSLYICTVPGHASAGMKGNLTVK